MINYLKPSEMETVMKAMIPVITKVKIDDEHFDLEVVKKQILESNINNPNSIINKHCSSFITALTAKLRVFDPLDRSIHNCHVPEQFTKCHELKDIVAKNLLRISGQIMAKPINEEKREVIISKLMVEEEGCIEIAN